MECNEFNQLLDALVDSELESQERQAAEEHLRTCPACAKLQDATLRVKRILRESAERPVPVADLKSRLATRLRREAAGGSAGSGSAGGWAATITSFGVPKVAAAAAMLVVATLCAFVLFHSAPRLGHHAAAEGVRDVFRDHHDLRDPERRLDDSRLRSYVEGELGVEYGGIDFPGGEFLGWRPEMVAGQKAVRLDFLPDPNVALSKLEGDAPIVSVFLLSMGSTEFSKDYIKQLEDGHYCQRCIQYEEQGTIYCLRKNELFVAAVSNVLRQSFDGFRVR